MANNLELYKCSVCGQIVEVVIAKQGILTCCNTKMELMNANTKEASAEKHIPVIEIKGEEKIVRVGAAPHPMEEAHYIQFIEVISKDKKNIKRKYLFPNEEAVMNLKCECSDDITIRELCNLHALWSNE
jgi:superoxide reductase